MPKSTQTRFLGILKEIITTTIHPYACFLDYNYRPIDVDLFTACYPWSVLDLYVGEINVTVVERINVPYINNTLEVP